ncbi:holin family protein [Rhodovulum marinum]|uniref:Holin (3TMs family) n=1 Tax=Rhodovulum marinum TaxID=320662 RepID=A0A4R2Q0W3_9RHOB|nr:holin family protein [Rhodovulum marinum]TCP42120.1 holin (3TMs family) [Rhodovulum marinum]
MGLIQGLAGILFGSGRNVVAEAAEVFRVNSDAADRRAAEIQTAALQQFAQEFAHPNRCVFDRVIDGMNRLPRPLLALGTVFLAASAMVDPVWFASRMQGVALVPEPLWWLLGAIISFYFGSRYQAKGQEFQRSIAETVARAPVVVDNLRALGELDAPSAPRTPAAPPTPPQPAPGGRGAGSVPADAPATSGATPHRSTGPNPALEAWRSQG